MEQQNTNTNEKQPIFKGVLGAVGDALPSYEKRLDNYREKVYWPEYEKHVSDKMKRLYPQIPAEAKPNEVIDRWRKNFAPDMSDEDFYAKLDDTYGEHFEPSVPQPKPNLIETAQMVATPENAIEMGKGIAHFGAGQAAAGLTEKFAGQAMAKALPAWMQKTFGKAPAGRSLGRIGGQLAMAAPTAVKLIGEQMAGSSLEKTAQEMPEPNIAVLQAKGYSPAQIANVLRGYAQVQKDLYEDMQKTGEEGVSTAAEGIANAAFFGFGGDKIKEVAGRLAGKVLPQEVKAVLKAGESVLHPAAYGARAQLPIPHEVVHAGQAAVDKYLAEVGDKYEVLAKAGEAAAAARRRTLLGRASAATKAVASGTAAHAVSGAAFGGGYGAVHGATERMAKAKAAGLGANDIFNAGISGAIEEGKPSAIIGGIIGGVIGAPAEMFTTTKAAIEGASARRKAIAAAHVEDAQRVNLQKFADEFKPAELPQRFPEDLAAAGGDDVALANNIVGGVWGEDVAATEAGQKAASRLYEKIAAWRAAREKLQGTMLDLPATVVEAPATSITPTLPFEGFEPTAQPTVRPGAVQQMPGVQPIGAGFPPPGGQAPQPNVIGEFKPTMERQQTAPPKGVKRVAGMQPVGAEVPVPEKPLVLEGVQPREGARVTSLGPNLGPIERGGHQEAPATEINPRLGEPADRHDDRATAFNIDMARAEQVAARRIKRTKGFDKQPESVQTQRIEKAVAAQQAIVFEQYARLVGGRGPIAEGKMKAWWAKRSKALLTDALRGSDPALTLDERRVVVRALRQKFRAIPETAGTMEVLSRYRATLPDMPLPLFFDHLKQDFLKPRRAA